MAQSENMVAKSYLVYGENGMRLLYAGDDAEAWAAACAGLDASSAGYVAGYQFVGRQRFDLRCYFDRPPSERFLALRARRDLFDFAWFGFEPDSAG